MRNEMNNQRRNCQKKIIYISLCAQTSERANEKRENYSYHELNLISSKKEQMGISVFAQNFAILEWQYFINIWSNSYEKKTSKMFVVWHLAKSKYFQNMSIYIYEIKSSRKTEEKYFQKDFLRFQMSI